MNIQPITTDSCIVRNTAAARGRTCAVEPGRTAARHLRYGRIILGAGDAPITFETRDRETSLIGLKGSATVKTEGSTYTLGRYDALYVPRDASIEVTPGVAGCDIAEVSSPVANHHPAQFVSYANVQSDPGLHFATGGPGAQRELNILIGKNVQAGRLMAGVTFSQPGNWTSWPPHEHAVLAEEAYLYIDMPAPAFGVQLVYTNKTDPEVATIVREGDVVLMPAGYHPNVAAPGGPINFLWMMAANREDDDRLFGVVNVQPEFATGGSGLDKGKK
jgi:5-deoxy-glucuronate isomerase